MKKDKVKKEVVMKLDDRDCPICMEKLENDELYFYPCSCSFQICRFCWHRIKNDENGLCPACRKPYSEKPVAYCPVAPTPTKTQNSEKSGREKKKEKKELIESRKHLAPIRVIQRNLVYVVGLPERAANDKNLRSIFEKYGKITSLILGNLPSNFSEEPLNTAYITYSNEDEALQAIIENDSLHIDDHNIKVTLGTTKYCQYFLNAETCTRTICSYLHEMAPPEISFTKEDMQQGKHMEYEKELIFDFLRSKNIIPSEESLSEIELKREMIEKEWERQKMELIEARKFLSTYRVIQRNLVYAVGLPPSYATEAALREIFEEFGEIKTLIVGCLPSNFSDEPLNTAYITYSNEDEALQAIFTNSSLRLAGRNIKVTLGTTKYCQSFLNAEACTRVDCAYLHEVAPAEISFTKEDMQQGRHIEYERELILDLLRSKNILAPPRPLMEIELKNDFIERELERQKMELIEARKFLTTYRVIQRNLVYVVGLPNSHATVSALRDLFEEYGEIKTLIVGSLPSNFSDEPLNTAYITYTTEDEALQAIFANSSLRLGGRNIKVTLGTTKYCQYFLKAEICTRAECAYLHELAPPEISFTKEDMQQGKHIEYEKELILDLLRSKNVIPPAQEQIEIELEREMIEKEWERQKMELIEARKFLSTYRVIQRNLVYAVGIPSSYATESALREIFGKYGQLKSLIVGCLPSSFSDEPLNTAYITYSNEDEALQAIFANNCLRLDGRSIKVTLGTTKYCQSFLNAEFCTRMDSCAYLHEVAPAEISFTKEDMQKGRHIEYEKELILDLLQSKKIISPPRPLMEIELKNEIIIDKEWERQKMELVEARKFLATYRVIQRNLVYVVGLPNSHATVSALRDLFEEYGTIKSLIVGCLPSNFSDEPLNTAYITYTTEDEALQAIFANSSLRLGGRNIKVTLGTTKYCQSFLRADICTRLDCAYLHELAPPEISFTKEDMQQGKHIEYEKELILDLFRSKNMI